MYSGQESFWVGSLFGPITVALLLKGTGAPSINTHTLYHVFPKACCTTTTEEEEQRRSTAGFLPVLCCSSFSKYKA